MSTDLTFRDYVLDDEHMKWYSDYQRKYARTVRESDKVLIEMVRAVMTSELADRERPTLLDIGCSTGNLLLHLGSALPSLDLVGGDMAPGIIAECRDNPELAGIDFAEMNMLDLGHQDRFDIVVANAALMFFSDAEFESAVRNIAAAVKPGGYFLAWDLFHPFDQEVEIVETTKSHPRGLRFHFRSFRRVREVFELAGLTPPDLVPFDIPIDLPRPEAADDVTTYTVKSEDERRLSFRGTLFQPWCHVRARRD